MVDQSVTYPPAIYPVQAPKKLVVAQIVGFPHRWLSNCLYPHDTRFAIIWEFDAGQAYVTGVSFWLRPTGSHFPYGCAVVP